MGVRDLIGGAGADEQLAAMACVCGKRAVEFVMVKGEPAFEAAGDPGQFPLPWSPFTERSEKGELVFLRNLFQEQARQRRGRFANGKARMPATFDQGSRPAEALADHRHEGTGESGTDHDDLEMVLAHAPAQAGHSMAGRMA